MTDIIMGPFSAHPSGIIGQEIRDPDGDIVAWTTDWLVAQVIVKVLNENEHLLVSKEN